MTSERFEDDIARSSVRYLRFVAVGEIVSGPGLAWLTPFLHANNPGMQEAFRSFQIGFGVAGLMTVVLLALPAIPRGAWSWIAIANALGISISLGISVARSPIPNEIPFHMVPCAFFVIPWTARMRALAMASMAIAFGIAVVATMPEQDDALALRAILYYACVATAGFLMGVMLVRVLHENWRQRRALADRATALEQLDRAKTELIANVSHELRTPLTLILSALEDLRPHAPEIAERGLRNAGRLTSLVDDMLALARFDAGRGSMVRTHGDLGALVREAARYFDPLPGGGVLITRVPEQRVTIHADLRQLRTVLFNLIANSIKFSDQRARRIAVTLEVVEHAAVLTIADNGAGIPADALPHIFDRFYQADGTATRRHGGVGIGLALTREIVSLHGGTITVRSELGAGTTFRIELPCHEEEPSVEPEHDDTAVLERARAWSATSLLRAPNAPRKSRIADASDTRPLVLVAEDDADLREYLVEILSREHRVIATSDGAEAARLFDATAPAVIISDLMMPERTGADLLRHVRATGAWVPFLILTARAEIEIRVDILDAGADDYLAKPFDERELMARVRLLLKLAEQERHLSDRNADLARRVAERTAQLQRLTAHLEASREEERRRIARELHDELGQILTGIRMEIGGARSRSEGPLHEVCTRIDALLDHAFAASRDLIYELRPRVLDDLGLVAAVESYVERFRERSGLDVAIHLTAPREPSPVVATTLFRALQESLTNVARHAYATHIEVVLLDNNDHLVLLVEDDGRGFDVSAPAGGFGLVGLRERAAAVGGRLDLHSGANGTSVTFTAPIATTCVEERVA